MFMENDVRDHAVVPLVGEECVDLRPRAVLVDVHLTKGGQAAVPVPLERIQPVGRDGVGAFVVLRQNLRGVVK